MTRPLSSTPTHVDAWQLRDAGLTQAEIAVRLGISQPTVSRLLRSVNKSWSEACGDVAQKAGLTCANVEMSDSVSRSKSSRKGTGAEKRQMRQKRFLDLYAFGLNAIRFCDNGHEIGTWGRLPSRCPLAHCGAQLQEPQPVARASV